MNILKKIVTIGISSLIILTPINIQTIYAKSYNYDSNYSSIRNYIDDVGNIYYRQRTLRGSSYFNYEDNVYTSIENNKIAKLFPANFKPNENTWPKKSDYTSRKMDLAEELADEIKYKRRYSKYDYFKQGIVNSMLSKYFPTAYSSSRNDTQRLENFLYYFGIVDAYYKQDTTKDINSFLFNYAEPMYDMLDLYDLGRFNDTDINSIRNNLQSNGANKVKDNKKTKEDSDYYKERNMKVLSERN